MSNRCHECDYKNAGYTLGSPCWFCDFQTPLKAPVYGTVTQEYISTIPACQICGGYKENKCRSCKYKPCGPLLQEAHRKCDMRRKKTENTDDVLAKIVGSGDITISPEDAVNLKRASIGVLTILDGLGVLIPRCRNCYANHGWLNKCICQKDVDKLDTT